MLVWCSLADANHLERFRREAQAEPLQVIGVGQALEREDLQRHMPAQ